MLVLPDLIDNEADAAQKFTTHVEARLSPVRDELV